jgi:2-keto-4-pentenoate hydratase/2-oxohepta-3-ene-1,7-dioic acid hydratase in catechol pathway
VCVNDVSVRDLQFSDGQWVRGKSPDTFCPRGPRVVPAAEISDPQNLSIRAILNGPLMQESTTANYGLRRHGDRRSSPKRSRSIPADLFAPGTPAGAFRDLPVFMQPAPRSTVEIAGIGSLTNVLRAARA